MNEEDEIIKSGLKSHSKVDTMCYAGMVFLAIMIFIPPICLPPGAPSSSKC